MTFFLYQCLFFCCLPIIAIILLWRPDTRKRFAHCCGFFRFEEQKSAPPTGGLWFHAVSYGETRLILRFIQIGLAENRINGHIIFTSTIENALQLFLSEAKTSFPHIKTYTCLYPLDWLPITKRFIRFIQPQALFLSETDLWPSLLTSLQQLKIPVYLINGRISRSMQRFLITLPTLARPMLNGIQKAFVQSEKDGFIFQTLKCTTTVQVTGNAKFDLISTQPQQQISLPDNLNKILLFGSFHKEEFPICVKIKQTFPHSFNLVIVPRKSDEIGILLQTLKKAGFSGQLLSENKSEFSADFLIVDTMGILSPLYYYCELAVIGGSFNQVGGHNFLEPIIFKKPVFIGPFTRNIQQDVSEFVELKLITQVKNENFLLQKLYDYCHNPADYIGQGIKANKHLESKRGILNKIWLSIPPTSQMSS